MKGAQVICGRFVQTQIRRAIGLSSQPSGRPAVHTSELQPSAHKALYRGSELRRRACRCSDRPGASCLSGQRRRACKALPSMPVSGSPEHVPCTRVPDPDSGLLRVVHQPGRQDEVPGVHPCCDAAAGCRRLGKRQQAGGRGQSGHLHRDHRRQQQCDGGPS